MNLEYTIDCIPKTTKPLVAGLKKLGVVTVRDVLMHLPYRYLDFSKVAGIASLKAEEAVTIEAEIKSIGSRFSFRGHMQIAEALVSDTTGSLKVVWFNQGYLAKTLSKGEKVFLSGTPEYYNGKLQLTNPLYEKVSDFPLHTARLVPLYHLTQTIYPKTFRRLVAEVLPLAKDLEDPIPHTVRESQNIPSLEEAVKLAHFPTSALDIETANRRFAFEEIFINQLLAQQYKLKREKQKTYSIKFDQPLVKDFVDSLPFTLTAGQKKAAWDIFLDMEKKQPMNRLVEGDVGSGKTLVAFMAALEAIKQDLQVAFIAPTEILARQHYESAQKHLSGANIILLTNAFAKVSGKDEKRDKLLALLKEGMPGLFVGTQALLQKKVKFKNLALVIIDEQHRFGVEQRAELLSRKGKVPHLLSLTATPIPRTLQLAAYGELDISTITTKPAGRKPIITKLVEPARRAEAYRFIAKQIESGRQAFVITPLIEESDTLGVKAVKSEFENLKKIFPKFTVGLLHGKLKASDKEAVMRDFLANTVHILVSTSVIEVGVDVPNASAMVIEGADRFGLAQLHQFRGRVGRADHQSYCLLFTENQNPDTLARLEAFTKTSDGFALAELDLKQRGFGQLYGSQQSGWNFKYFSPAYTSLIEPARSEARNILKDDLELDNHPLLKQKIEGKIIHLE